MRVKEEILRNINIGGSKFFSPVGVQHECTELIIPAIFKSAEGERKHRQKKRGKEERESERNEGKQAEFQGSSRRIHPRTNQSATQTGLVAAEKKASAAPSAGSTGCMELAPLRPVLPGVLPESYGAADVDV